MNSPSDIFTVEEAAIYLKVPISSIYKLAQEGKIPAQKVGRHWRFHRLALDHWISGMTSTMITKKENQESIQNQSS